MFSYFSVYFWLLIMFLMNQKVCLHLKKREAFTSRLLKALQNKLIIIILSIETKQKRVIWISQIMTYGTTSKLFTPNCVPSFISFLLLCLYFYFFFPVHFVHLSIASSFLLEHLPLCINK